MVTNVAYMAPALPPGDLVLIALLGAVWGSATVAKGWADCLRGRSRVCAGGVSMKGDTRIGQVHAFYGSMSEPRETDVPGLLI